MKKYVFGHRNPDTDAVVSAVVYAGFLKSRDEDVEAVALGELNNETKFVLEKFGVGAPEVKQILPKGSEVVLVDHNEEKQSVSNLSELRICEVVDHHKVNFQTAEPVNVRIEKLGSTCSVIYKIFKEVGYKISKQEASLLISGIISDTLYFRSPTTTEEDKKICAELNKVGGIKDLEKYSLKMFEVKSDLGNVDVKKMIKMDYKEFEFGGAKYGIGVIETTNPSYALGRKSEILAGLKKIKEQDCLKGILVSIIDILNEHNKTLAVGEHEAEVLRAVFNGEEIEHCVYSLGSVISRKKQIVPKLEKHFGK